MTRAWEPASHPAREAGNRLGSSRREDELLGQGREVRRGERQMGKQRRRMQLAGGGWIQQYPALPRLMPESS